MVRKLDLSFQIHINNDVKYLISSKNEAKSKFQGNKAPKIQLNQESLSFDLVFDNEKAECPPLHEISNVKILAVMKKQSLMRNILELDFKKVLKEQVFNQKGHFIKMKMLNLDVIQILDSSTIIMGHFENSGSGYK